MKNYEVAKLLRNIAELLEIKEDSVFKIRAYERAATVISNLSEDIEDVWKQGKLEELPGVGEAISEKVGEYLKKGTLGYYEGLKKTIPFDVESLRKIPGLGPKTLMKLYKNLGVKDLATLEKAAREGKIAGIVGLGEKVQENILKSIAFAKGSTRIPLDIALHHAEDIIELLKKHPSVKRIDIAGSLRRRKDTIRDIDILIASPHPEKVMEAFASMPQVEQVLAKGTTKSSVRLSSGIQADARIVDEANYGAALLYFTGSAQHNIELRKISIAKGYKLSEYGLFTEKGKPIAGKTEHEIYQELGMAYIEPELREAEGEIEAAQHHKLPALLTREDIKGDLQMHSTWSDGSNSIEDMALAAKEWGHEYICMSDHGGTIGSAVNAERVKEYVKEIDSVNKKVKGIVVLKGMEVNITKDGMLDMPNSVLKDLDIVLAGIHSSFKGTEKQTTSRIIKAMENEHVDIIAHPTGRKINEREPYDVDFDAVFEKAKSTNTVLEINAHPKRLDLKDIHVKAAVEHGIKLSIGTDSHATESLKNIRFGLYMARRGWAQKKDLINTLPLKKMLATLK
jgi:DNA polymerase (family 10)